MKRLLLFAFACLTCYNVFSQPTFSCLAKPPAQPSGSSGSQPSSCNQLLKDLIPTSSDSALEVKVRMWIFTPPTGTGTWDTVTKQRAKYALDWVNSLYDSLHTPNLTVPGVPYVRRAKIKFVLDTFVKKLNDTLYHYIDFINNPNNPPHPIYNVPGYVNILYSGSQPDSVDALGNVITWQYGAFTDEIFQDRILIKFLSGEPGTPYADIAGSYFLGTLAHELAHTLGVWHTPADNSPCGSETTVTVGLNFGCCTRICPDDFVKETPPYSDCSLGGSNNMMLGANADCQRYLSPQQMAVMHYYLRTNRKHFLTSASYIKATTVNHTYDYTLSSNETWSTDRYMKGNVIIPNGKVLTIQCAVAMARDSRLIIYPGGKLSVYGGTITNISGHLWGGIDVMGNPYLGQSYSHQGVLELYAACLTNAYTAVRNYGHYYVNGNIDYGSTGGIIKATSSIFLNNIRDVEFLATPITINSASRFFGCEFKTTAAIKDGTISLAPYVHISLWSVKGVEVNGCVFENAAQTLYPYTGEGVHSIDAIYTFDDWNNLHNQFKGFNKAISVNNINAQRPVNVYATNFNDNKQGIVYANMENVNIEDNLFALKAAGSIGISLNYNKYYKVANNTFFEITTTNSWKAGIYASYSGDGAHRIYRNNFSGMYMGIAPQFNNSGPTNLTDGLYMNCNDFTIGTSNTWDIAMLGNGANSNVMPTVAQYQGVVTNPFDAKKLVRNQYRSTCVPGGMRKWYVALASTKGIEHAANSDTVTRPTPQPDCSSSLLNIINSNWPLSYNTDCQSTGNRPATDENCPCRNCCLYDDISAGLSEALNKTATLSAYVTGTIDAGSTIDLVNNMNNSGLSVPQKMALLVAASPYVSDEALIAFIEQSAVVGGDVIAIHDLNKPVTQSVWEAIEGKGFSGGTMATLEDQQDDQPMSARRTLEGELNLVKADLQFIYSEKLNYFLNDTLDHSHDTVIKLLSENLGGLPDAPVQLINAYANAGRYGNAFDQVESLGSDPDYTELMTLYHTLLVLDTSEKKIFYALENNDLKNILEEYADDSTMAGSSLARAVLNAIEDRPMNFQYLLPEDAPGERMMGQLTEEEASQNAATETPSPVFRLYPNPAGNSFYLGYFVPEKQSSEISFVLRDVVGKEISNGKLKTNTEIEIDAAGLNNGIYFITLIQDERLVKSQKIVILK